ncbi:Uncharacterised protein [Klebsiella pneumoniae subsp. ozaenae]|uniref:Uncharacterized protein n=1 Tax=Klebsiella pneumoniae subsp. ozaenae TaxID=574 RepID=A0A378UER4_KLEPO|nr:Uncharacterised protein [Klebsiella pneumoniae subsp. ozaenae]
MFDGTGQLYIRAVQGGHPLSGSVNANQPNNIGYRCTLGAIGGHSIAIIEMLVFLLPGIEDDFPTAGIERDLSNLINFGNNS